MVEARTLLSVVVPALNEAENLDALLPELLAVIHAAGGGEIIVVDDGSADETSAVAGAHGARVVRHERRRGYGAAVWSGLTAASGALVAYLDGDRQFAAAELSLLVGPILAGEADLVAGGRADRRDGPHRRSLGGLYNALVQRVTETTFTDVDCGFKAMRRTVVESLSLRCSGNLFGAELMGKAHHAGFRVRECPVSHRPRALGHAKGADLFAIAHACREIVRWWPELRPAG